MRLEWAFQAEEDRVAIFDTIEADSPRAAVRMDDRICSQIEQLMQFPKLGRVGRVPGTRELVLVRTPYIAAYRMEDDRVILLRILHGAQQWPDAL